jgi:hypothetical protein
MDVDLTGARVLDLLVTGTSFLVGEAGVDRKRKRDAHLKDNLLCVIHKTIDIQATRDRSNMLTGVLRVAIAKLELAKRMAGFGEVSRHDVTADKRCPFILHQKRDRCAPEEEIGRGTMVRRRRRLLSIGSLCLHRHGC